MQLPQVARARFLRCPAESDECELGRGNGAACIFLIAQRCAGDHFAVGRLENVHDFATMRLDERPIDVVLRDCFNPVSLGDCFPRCHCVSPYMSFYSQNEVTATRVSDPSFNAAQPSFHWRGNVHVLAAEPTDECVEYKCLHLGPPRSCLEPTWCSEQSCEEPWAGAWLASVPESVWPLVSSCRTSPT